MRLLVDAHVFDGKFQGTRTYLEGMYKELIKHEEIDFFFAAQDKENLCRVFGKHHNVHYIQLAPGGSIKRLALQWPKIIKKYSIDWAHYQYISPLRKCCKEIVTVHDLLFLDMPEFFPLSYRAKNNFFFHRSAMRADLLLTVSSFSKDEIVRHFKISPEKIFITPNSVLPIEDSVILPDIKGKWDMNKYILTVGRYEPRKNMVMLMQAFSDLELHKKGYKLVMIGSPDINYNEFYEFIAKADSDLKDAIITDKASFTELVALYKQANLFVFPSLGEGFGIPPLEAIVYGCPLLCSNATAMAEFDLPEEMMFDPTDIEDLKVKMQQSLLGDPIKADKEKILQKFNWHKSADVLYATLNTMK